MARGLDDVLTYADGCGELRIAGIFEGDRSQQKCEQNFFLKIGAACQRVEVQFFAQMKRVASGSKLFPGCGTQPEADGQAIIFFGSLDELINAESDGLIKSAVSGRCKVGAACNSNQNSAEIRSNA